MVQTTGGRTAVQRQGVELITCGAGGGAAVTQGGHAGLDGLPSISIINDTTVDQYGGKGGLQYFTVNGGYCVNCVSGTGDQLHGGDATMPASPAAIAGGGSGWCVAFVCTLS